MSKSLGNFFTIRQVLQHYDAQTLRLFIIRTHYRSPLQYSQVHLDDARAALRRLYTALAQVPLDAEAAPAVDWSQGHALRFAQAMDMDFGTPEAVAVLFDVAAELNRNPSPSLAHLLRALAGCLGLLQQDAQQWLQAGPVGSTGEKEVGLSHAAVEALIAQRQQAKAQRDFAQADALRMQLQSQGIALKDGPTGTTWERVAKA